MHSKPPRKNKMYHNILITRTDRMGDVVLSTPVASTLRRHYPKAKITFCTTPYTADVVAQHPDVDEVIVYDKKGEYKNFFKNISFIKKIASRKFDLALILHPTNRMHFVTALAGIPERMGYRRKFGFLLTRSLKHTKQFGHYHERDYTLKILELIGIKNDLYTKTFMATTKSADEQVRRILENNLIADDEDFVAIHPGASCRSKRWPVENFADVADMLCDRLKLPIILVGGHDTSAIAVRLKTLSKAKILNLTGLLSLKELASLLKKSRLLLTNDSGPMHVATAVGTPVVAVFGRTDPGLSVKRWGPLGKYDIIFHEDPGCKVCLAHNCTIDFECLRLITAPPVADAVIKLCARKKIKGA